MTDIFISTGERSGDILGARLLSTLPKGYLIEGILGPELRKKGLREVAPMETLQIMGFTEIVCQFPKLFSFLLQIKRHILTTAPKVVLLIDSPDFHLPLAYFLRKGGFRGKIVQVVCPSIWAWRHKRKKSLEAHFDLLLTLFPFENELFTDSPLETLYLGHPLVEALSLHKKEQLDSLQNKKVLALFPGSRKAEIVRHLPLQLAATRELSEYTRAIGISDPSHLSLLRTLLAKEPVPPLLLLPEERYALMQSAEFALAKFGTITLELCLFEVPTITHFTLPLVERVLLQHLFKVRLHYYALPNIIAKREIFPEHLFPKSSLEMLRKECHSFAASRQRRDQCKKGCCEIKKILQAPSSEIFSQKMERLLSF